MSPKDAAESDHPNRSGTATFDPCGVLPPERPRKVPGRSSGQSEKARRYFILWLRNSKAERGFGLQVHDDFPLDGSLS